MKDGIKEILENLKNKSFGEYELEYVDDVISRKDIKLLLDYITNLQEENEYSNYCNEQLRKKIANLEYKIKKAEENNKQLKELCDKYEEEHNTTFQKWLKELKENK